MIPETRLHSTALESGGDRLYTTASSTLHCTWLACWVNVKVTWSRRSAVIDSVNNWFIHWSHFGISSGLLLSDWVAVIPDLFHFIIKLKLIQECVATRKFHNWTDSICTDLLIFVCLVLVVTVLLVVSNSIEQRLFTCFTFSVFSRKKLYIKSRAKLVLLASYSLFSNIPLLVLADRTFIVTAEVTLFWHCFFPGDIFSEPWRKEIYTQRDCREKSDGFHIFALWLRYPEYAISLYVPLTSTTSPFPLTPRELIITSWERGGVMQGDVSAHGCMYK